MVDTVFLIGTNSNLTSIIGNLKEVMDMATGEVKSKGNVRNLSIRFSGEKVTIIGSLSKYYFGTNFFDLNRDQLKKAVNKLNSELGFPIDDFDVYQLHIAKTIPMDHPVSFYLEYFTCYPRHRTMFFPGESITFTNGLRSLLVYDKVKELEKKDKKSFYRLESEGHLDNKYFLRYELQIKGRLKGVLGSKNTIKVKQLYDQSTYDKIVTLWKDYFLKIEMKPEILDISFDRVSSTKELNNSIFTVGTDKIGRDNLCNLLGRLHSSDQIDTSAYYREKKKINSATNKFTFESKYLRELKNKIMST